jgi:hypothetical protein
LIAACSASEPRVARRMSLTTCSAGALVVMAFFIIFNSMWGQDETQNLCYAITLNCSMGVDAGHCKPCDLADRQLLPQMHPSDDVQ